MILLRGGSNPQEVPNDQAKGLAPGTYRPDLGKYKDFDQLFLFQKISIDREWVMGVFLEEKVAQQISLREYRQCFCLKSR